MKKPTQGLEVVVSTTPAPPIEVVPVVAPAALTEMVAIQDLEDHLRALKDM